MVWFVLFHSTINPFSCVAFVCFVVNASMRLSVYCSRALIARALVVHELLLLVLNEKQHHPYLSHVNRHEAMCLPSVLLPSQFAMHGSPHYICVVIGGSIAKKMSLDGVFLNVHEYYHYAPAGQNAKKLMPMTWWRTSTPSNHQKRTCKAAAFIGIFSPPQVLTIFHTTSKPAKRSNQAFCWLSLSYEVSLRKTKRRRIPCNYLLVCSLLAPSLLVVLKQG